MADTRYAGPLPSITAGAGRWRRRAALAGWVGMVAWLALQAGVGVRAAASPQLPGPALGFLAGPVGFVGFAGYHMVRVERLNAYIEQYNGSNNAGDPDLPLLPSTGYAPGFGVFVPLSPRLAFVTAGSELTVERREPWAFVRLRANQAQVGLQYLWRQGSRWQLSVGGLVGLAMVELEWAVRRSSCSSPVDSCLQGARWTRTALSLQPEVGWHLRLTPTATLIVSVGYLVATDFWNPQWAHGIGDTVPGSSEVLSAAVLRAGLVVRSQ